MKTGKYFSKENGMPYDTAAPAPQAEATSDNSNQWLVGQTRFAGAAPAETAGRQHVPTCSFKGEDAPCHCGETAGPQVRDGLEPITPAKENFAMATGEASTSHPDSFLRETVGEMTPEHLIEARFSNEGRFSKEEVVSLMEAYAKQSVEQAERQRDRCGELAANAAIDAHKATVRAESAEAKVSALEREKQHWFERFETQRNLHESLVESTVGLDQKVSALERERDESRTKAFAAGVAGGNERIRANAAEAKVEQLCGDVKAVQKDYSEAVAKLGKMREALRAYSYAITQLEQEIDFALRVMPELGFDPSIGLMRNIKKAQSNAKQLLAE